MLRIFKYLKESGWSVLAIVVLLVVQAYCDLALPQYTADIVDVGIGQKGIENAVPERMREAVYDNLLMLMTEEEAELMSFAYEQAADGSYVFCGDKDTMEKLDESMGILILILSMAEEGGTMPDITGAGPESSFGYVLSDELVLAFRERVLEGLGDTGETVITQRAVQFLQEEYGKLGMDSGKIQRNYLYRTGGRMLIYSVVMMATAILVGFLASRIGAKLGLNLRERVFTKVVSFSHGEMERFSTASLITRSTNDIQQVQMVVVVMLRMVVYAPIIGIGGVVKVLRTRTGMGWIIVVAVAAIMVLVGISKASSYVVTTSGLPHQVLALFSSVTESKVIVLLLLNLLFLVIGMLMEANAAIIMMTPILLPLLNAFGIDTLQFGIIMSFNLCLGLVTPPVGICLLMTNQIADASFVKTLKAVMPMLLIGVIVLLLVTYIPQVTTFLPAFIQ